ncbi:hypothetical protein CLOM_g7170 [Closterium sp. NIES-68]|nr:hypothetical protein CLOM_g7170 [Closterium sp. NIES-68]GJP78975.1 hypothetical protein CLOP_g9232 [Closterium sp. NIES-67]
MWRRAIGSPRPLRHAPSTLRPPAQDRPRKHYFCCGWRAGGHLKKEGKLEPHAYWPLDAKMLNRRAGKGGEGGKGGKDGKKGPPDAGPCPLPKPEDAQAHGNLTGEPASI